MADPNNWRALVAVHPAADMLPMLSPDELDELGRDIDANGLRVPLVFVQDPANPSARLLDGRNRLAAMAQIYRDDAKAFRQWLARAPKRFLSNTDPEALVLSLNIHRRHLTTEQRRDLIGKLLKTDPSKSNLAIARLAKVSDKTVATVRAEVERRSEIPNVTQRTDSKGRQQPATKPTRASVAAANQPRLVHNQQYRPAAQQRDLTVVGVSRLLVADPAGTVADLMRLCAGSAAVAALPDHKRVGLARGWLSALNVSLDDLRPIEPLIARR